MSWENDKGLFIFMILLVIFIIFAGFMAIRSSKKNKQSPIDSSVQQAKDQQNWTLFGYGFFIFLGVLWLASAVLILILQGNGILITSFTIPRIMSLPYDALGIIGGAIVQIVLSLAVIYFSIHRIRQRISKKGSS